MRGNFFYSMQDMSREETLALAYYFYQLCLDMNEFGTFEEGQYFYRLLVAKLHLAEHSKKVVEAVVREHVKHKRLTVKRNASHESHPYDARCALDVVYKEDAKLYETYCEINDWSTMRVEDIELVRAVFGGKEEDFASIIGYTFFCEPNEKRKTFTIPENFKVPEEIVAYSRDTKFVDFLIDAFRFTEEEGLLLNIAYLSHTVKESYPIFNHFVNHCEEPRYSVYSKCTGLSVKTVKTLLRRDKKLVSYDFLCVDGDINRDAADCIYAGDINVFFSDVLKADEKKDIYELSSFSVKEDESELARYIAEKLNKKIILKRVSDIMSKWVGENERNIANAFSEAEASGDVLLFDEADSFFSNRENSVATWERTFVNEFLTQMEEFSGILICTTNLRKIMDPAMQRRFHILTEFKPLEKRGIEKLLGKFFSAYSFDSKLLDRLSCYDSVTPGDFGTLAGKIRFMPKSEISSALIINELCQIQEEKDGAGRRIGFVG